MLAKSRKVLDMMHHITKEQQSFGWQFIKAYEIIDSHDLIENPTNQLLMKMSITNELGNLKGSLHGGAAATIVDTATTIAIAACDNKNRVNVSSDLSMTYMGAAFLNTDIYILSQVNRIGKRLAFTECSLFNEEGDLLMTGRHTKAFLDTTFDLEK